jgi:hypothetical protein
MVFSKKKELVLQAYIFVSLISKTRCSLAVKHPKSSPFEQFYHIFHQLTIDIVGEASIFNLSYVRVPTNGSNVVKTPIDTDSLVLGICKNQLGVKLNLTDIGRSHPIGEIPTYY